MAQRGLSTVRVGAVIAAALAVLCFAIFQIGHGSRIFTKTETLESHFQRTAGLQSGAPVMLAGVRIGAVDAIEFPADPNSAYVVVRMWVSQQAAPRVRTDSVAQIDSMGLLGDKYVELTTGSPQSPAAAPGAVISARDPIDYEALLQKPGVSDMFDNLVAISTSMRSILDSIQNGHSLLAEFVRGNENAPPQDRLSLATIQRAMVHLDQLSTQLADLTGRLQRGQGVMGAMLSEKTNGQAFITSLWQAATSAQKAADDADRMLTRFDQAKGIVPQLLEDKQYAADVLANLRSSSRDLNGILRKINAGQGTAGLIVNDPKLYNQLTGFLDSSGGWGIRLVQGLYNLTHPFASPQPGPTTQQVMFTTAEGPGCPVQSTSPPVTSAVPAVMTIHPISKTITTGR
ncbi:MAG TPA: MlaD family protein [Candidatus Binataceae bacterium]|nr:MlaD family protein [Candidatus Binataceae bacterium]